MSNDQQYNQDDQEFDNWRETFVSQTYRLFKLCRIHELDNEAAETAIEGTAETFQDILAMGVEYMDVIFAGDNIFVNGKPLRANREVYTTVLELGELLKEVQLNEITIREGVEASDLRAMLKEYLARREQPDRRDDGVVEPTDAIRYRRVDPKKLLDMDEEADQTAEEQVMNLYPAAVVTMRRFVTEIKEQKFRALRIIKRLSQRLVALSDSAPETLLAVTAMKKTRDDEGGIAVNSGVLAMLMGRHLTDSYRALQRLCFAGMTVDLGRPRAAGIYKRSSTPNVIPNLNMSGKEELGPSNALLLLRNSRLREPTLRRATVAYEAGWLRYEHDIGWPFGDNRRPTLEAFIVRVARRFWELMALKPSMNQRRTPKQVFDTLLEEADSLVERAVVRLLMETLAYYEQGTMVELSEGWRGVVVEPGQNMAEFPRPVVRVVRDPNGNAIDAQDLDLADESLDLARFGLVRRRLQKVNDDRLRQAAQDLRPDDWNKRHGRPAQKSRERSTPRSKSSNTEQKKQQKRQQTQNQKPRSDRTPDQPSQPGQSGESLAATSQELSAAAKKSAPASDSSPGGDSDDDGTGVLEFGPGTAQAIRSGERPDTSADSSPSGAGGDQAPPSTPSSPSGEQSAESTDDEDTADTLQEISADAIEPTQADGGQPEEPDDDQLGDLVDSEQQRESHDSGQGRDEGLLRDHIDSVDDENEPGSGEGDAIAAGTEGGDAIAAGPEEGDAVAPDAATQQMSSEESAEALDNFVDGDVAHDDDTQRVSSEESAQVLGDFVEDAGDDPAESGADDATQQVEGGKSQEILRDFVDEPDEQTDSLAEDTSPEEETKTERVGSKQSQEILQDFVDEASGEADGADDASTEAISSEKSEELLDSFVDEESSVEDEAAATEAMDPQRSQEMLENYVDEPGEGSEPIDDPNDSKLGQLASDIDHGSADIDEESERVSTEKSHELMRDFVDESGDGDEDSTAATTNISRDQLEQSMEEKSGDSADDSDGADDSNHAATENMSRDEIKESFEEIAKQQEDDESD